LREAISESRVTDNALYQETRRQCLALLREGGGVHLIALCAIAGIAASLAERLEDGAPVNSAEAEVWKRHAANLASGLEAIADNQTQRQVNALVRSLIRETYPPNRH